MSPDRGWFESEEDYRERTAREADERTIECSTGSAPSKGWFENDEDYRERISREANEHIIEDSSGSSPSKGWFESDDDYRDRLSREANERIVEDATGSSPSRGWIESDEDYEVRLRKEANEQTIERRGGAGPQKGWFEGDHDYRSRVAHEARELRARERSTADGSSTYTSEVSSDESNLQSRSSDSKRHTSSGIGGFTLAVLVIFAVALILMGKSFSWDSLCSLVTANPVQYRFLMMIPLDRQWRDWDVQTEKKMASEIGTYNDGSFTIRIPFLEAGATNAMCIIQVAKVGENYLEGSWHQGSWSDGKVHDKGRCTMKKLDVGVWVGLMSRGKGASSATCMLISSDSKDWQTVK